MRMEGYAYDFFLSLLFYFIIDDVMKTPRAQSSPNFSSVLTSLSHRMHHPLPTHTHTHTHDGSEM